MKDHAVPLTMHRLRTGIFTEAMSYLIIIQQLASLASGVRH